MKFQLYTISQLQNLSGWIKGLQNCVPQKFPVSHEYKNLVIRFLGFMALNKFPETSFCLEQNRKRNENGMIGSKFGITNETFIPAESIPTYLLWSKDQLNVIQSKETHVVLNGDYGSGKTFILKVTYI